MKQRTETSKKTERTLQSVLRGFNVLELVAASHGGLPLKDIAGQMGLKPPTAHILLNTLVTGGYLARTSADLRYRLGEAAFRLTDRYLENILRQGAEQTVRGLARQLPKATVIFAEPRNGDITVLFRVSPDIPNLIQTPRERYMQPYASATALACQAFWTRDENLAFRQRHDFYHAGISLWGNGRKLNAFLNKARKQGCAMPDFPGNPLRTIGAPVFNRRGQLAAALGVSMPAAEFTAMEAKIIATVTGAAKTLSTSV